MRSRTPENSLTPTTRYYISPVIPQIFSSPYKNLQFVFFPLLAAVFLLLSGCNSSTQSADGAQSNPINENASPTLLEGPHEFIVGNVRFWFRVAGTALADAPPVVFLHGGPGQGSQSFASLIGPQLEPSLQMIYYDQRGSGRSERPYNHEYSIPILVKDIEDLRRELGVQQINIIAQSFGGVLALEYAAAYPQHVNKMVIAAGLSDAPWTLREMCKHLEKVDAIAHSRAIERGGVEGCNPFAAYKGSEKQAFFNRNMFPNETIRKKLEAADTINGLRNTGEIGKALFSQGLLNYRFDSYEKLTMPVLVIAGELDFQIGLAPQQGLANRLPNAKFLQYKNAGHFMYLDTPKRFVSDVKKFLSK